MAQRRQDWQITTAELKKRMPRWKDRTLAQKLKRIGLTPNDFGYSDRSSKKILKGQQRIGAAQRRRMEKAYAENVQDFTPPTKWFTVEAFVNSRKDESLAKEFSIIRLQDRGLFFVHQEGSTVTFTNKQVSGAPKQTSPSPQLVIYVISVEDEEGVESWMQASEVFYMGDNPRGTKERNQAKEHVAEFNQRNQDAQTSGLYSNEIYTWWARGVSEASYQFLGIGVFL